MFLEEQPCGLRSGEQGAYLGSGVVDSQENVTHVLAIERLPKERQIVRGAGNASRPQVRQPAEGKIIGRDPRGIGMSRGIRIKPLVQACMANTTLLPLLQG